MIESPLLIQILPSIATLLLTSIGTFFAIKLNRLQQRKSWLDTFNSLHTAFWNDDDIRIIRCCIAYDAAYEELAMVLSKRQREEKLSEAEYRLLDKLDKFLNLLSRVATLGKEFPDHRELWDALFFEWWFARCFHATRAELSGYIRRFYAKGLYRLHQELMRDGLSVEAMTALPEVVVNSREQ